MTLTHQPSAVDAGNQPEPFRTVGAPDGPAQPWQPLDRSARWVVRGFALQAALLVAVLFGELNLIAVLARVDNGTTTMGRAEFADRWDLAASIGWIGALLITAVVFMAWFRRAHRNLGALEAYGMQRSSGWAIGAWFVPFANLVMPKRIADEIWRGSEPDTASRNVHRSSGAASGQLVTAWWTLWIAAALVGWVANQLWRAADDTGSSIAATGVSVLHSAVLLAALVAAALVVTRITERQRVRAALLGIEAEPATVRRSVVAPLAVGGLAGLVAAAALAGASLRSGAGEPTIGELAAEGHAADVAAADAAALAVEQDSAALTAVDQACFDFGETMTALGEPEDLPDVVRFFEEVMSATATRDGVIASAAFASPEERSAFDAHFWQPIEADTAVMRASLTPVVEAARAGNGERVDSLLASYPETQGTVEAAAAYANERDMQSCAAIFGPPPPDV